MTDDELRALVRDAIARHLPASARPASSASEGGTSPVPVPLWRSHPSFGKYLLPTGTDQDGPCLIEPTVTCNHCGFCLSHGH
jgi:hypothetical protein